MVHPRDNWVDSHPGRMLRHQGNLQKPNIKEENLQYPSSLVLDPVRRRLSRVVDRLAMLVSKNTVPRKIRRSASKRRREAGLSLDRMTGQREDGWSSANIREHDAQSKAPRCTRLVILILPTLKSDSFLVVCNGE